jgi:hypothetical protein
MEMHLNPTLAGCEAMHDGWLIANAIHLVSMDDGK